MTSVWCVFSNVGFPTHHCIRHTFGVNVLSSNTYQFYLRLKDSFRCLHMTSTLRRTQRAMERIDGDFWEDAKARNHDTSARLFWWNAIKIFRWWKRTKPKEEGFICKQLDAWSSCELRWSFSDTRKRHGMMAIRFYWPVKDGVCCLWYRFQQYSRREESTIAPICVWNGFLEFNNKTLDEKRSRTPGGWSYACCFVRNTKQTFNRIV